MSILPLESANQDLRIESCSANIAVDVLVGSMCKVSSPICEWKELNKTGFSVDDDVVPLITDIL